MLGDPNLRQSHTGWPQDSKKMLCRLLFLNIWVPCYDGFGQRWNDSNWHLILFVFLDALTLPLTDNFHVTQSFTCRVLFSPCHCNFPPGEYGQSIHMIFMLRNMDGNKNKRANLTFPIRWESNIMCLFPTCQVRLVRFYQSACPPLPPPPPPPPSPPPPRLAVLLALLLASASSTSTSALPTLPTRRQALRQLPSSVRTAGRQPASCPAQCAPLDLNLRAAQLSVHRWTSTGDLPSSACTAGPQPGTCPAQCAPLDLNLGPSQLSVHRWTSTAR